MDAKEGKKKNKAKQEENKKHSSTCPSYNFNKSSVRTRNQSGSTNELEQVLFGTHWVMAGRGWGIAGSAGVPFFFSFQAPNNHIHSVVLNFGLFNNALVAGSCRLSQTVSTLKYVLLLCRRFQRKALWNILQLYLFTSHITNIDNIFFYIYKYCCEHEDIYLCPWKKRIHTGTISEMHLKLNRKMEQWQQCTRYFLFLSHIDYMSIESSSAY